MQGVEHPAAPSQKAFHRSEVLFTLNLLTDITPRNTSTNTSSTSDGSSKGDDSSHSNTTTTTTTSSSSRDECSSPLPPPPPPPQTELVTVSHVRYSGGVPPFLVARRAFQGLVDFMAALDSFAAEKKQQQKQSLQQ
jgi:hypothetical protein